jgi:PKD repeat protein
MAGAPHRLPVLSRAAGVLAAALVVSACGNGDGATDAMPTSDAMPPGDAMVMTDASASLSWVTFAVTGCASDTGPDVPCTGSAPLELGFTALAPAAIDTYLWDFGDSATSNQAHPVHVYTEPGSYDVSLIVAGERGTAMAVRPGLVQVGPAPLGARCTADSQCDAGRECVCGQDTACAAGLEPGFCTEACRALAPCAEGVCADLGASAPASPADWQRALCVPDCASSACPAGLACHELPAPGGGWVKGCFAAGVLGAMGESCVDAAGNPDHGRCASGHCATLGARGACSWVCTAGGCPDSSACAAFAGANRCILRCEDADACTADPWLACELPGGAGALGFTVDEPAAAQGYCAPRSCTSPTECGADGACTGGYCGP